VTTDGITCTKTSGCDKIGSHISTSFIKEHYINCGNCWSVDVKAKACATNRAAHKHYYCICGKTCTGSARTQAAAAARNTSNNSSSGGGSGSGSSGSGGGSSGSSSSGGSCSKQGSHTSIDWIKSRYSNCVNCGKKTGSDGKTVYYCYCGSGCTGSSGGSSSSGGKSGGSSSSSSGSGVKVCKTKKVCKKWIGSYHCADWQEVCVK
jgi:hypothetical protein